MAFWLPANRKFNLLQCKQKPEICQPDDGKRNYLIHPSADIIITDRKYWTGLYYAQDQLVWEKGIVSRNEWFS